MTPFVQQPDYEGAEFTGLSMAGATFREVDLSGARSATPEGMRDAVDVIEELWQATVRRAGALPEEAVYRSVDGEWSLAQTLRHTIFVVDA